MKRIVVVVLAMILSVVMSAVVFTQWSPWSTKVVYQVVEIQTRSIASPVIVVKHSDDRVTDFSICDALMFCLVNWVDATTRVSGLNPLIQASRCESNVFIGRFGDTVQIVFVGVADAKRITPVCSLIGHDSSGIFAMFQDGIVEFLGSLVETENFDYAGIIANNTMGLFPFAIGGAGESPVELIVFSVNGSFDYETAIVETAITTAHIGECLSWRTVIWYTMDLVTGTDPLNFVMATKRVHFRA